jgi:hypothetical protein
MRTALGMPGLSQQALGNVVNAFHEEERQGHESELNGLGAIGGAYRRGDFLERRRIHVEAHG